MPIEVPPGVSNQTHKRVTMRNVVDYTPDGRGRYVIVNEAIDFVPNGQVDGYVADAQNRWNEVFATNPNAAAPPVYRPN